MSPSTLRIFSSLQKKSLFVEATEHQTKIVPYVVLITNVSKSENSKTDGGALIPLWLRYFQHFVQMKVKKKIVKILCLLTI